MYILPILGGPGNFLKPGHSKSSFCLFPVSQGLLYLIALQPMSSEQLFHIFVYIVSCIWWKKSKFGLCYSILAKVEISLNCFFLFLFFSFFFETEFRSCYPGWSAMARSRLTAASASWVQAILLLQPPE